MNRTTIGSNHVYGALDELEFGNFKDKLVKALEDYKSSQSSKKEAKAKKKSDEAAKEDNIDSAQAPIPLQKKDDVLEIDS